MHIQLFMSDNAAEGYRLRAVLREIMNDVAAVLKYSRRSAGGCGHS